MELLPFLYALLAAFTGVSAGDRVALADRAPVAACASNIAHEQRQVARVAPVVVRPSKPEFGRFFVAQLWSLVSVDALTIFRIAGFAVRRQ